MRTHLPDVPLLRRAASGDADARSQVLRMAAPTVLRWCTRLADPSEAEDVAHDVLTHVLDHLSGVRDLAAFPSWLWRVTTREAARQQRRAKLRSWLSIPADAALDPGQERGDLARRVREVLASLPRRQREILLLCELEGYTDSEAAVLLQVPLGTVKSRLGRAREGFMVEVRRRGLVPPGAEGTP